MTHSDHLQRADLPFVVNKIRNTGRQFVLWAISTRMLCSKKSCVLERGCPQKICLLNLISCSDAVCLCVYLTALWVAVDLTLDLDI
jgi:hypothetical protein